MLFLLLSLSPLLLLSVVVLPLQSVSVALPPTPNGTRRLFYVILLYYNFFLPFLYIIICIYLFIIFTYIETLVDGRSRHAILAHASQPGLLWLLLYCWRLSGAVTRPNLTPISGARYCAIHRTRTFYEGEAKKKTRENTHRAVSCSKHLVFPAKVFISIHNIYICNMYTSV